MKRSEQKWEWASDRMKMILTPLEVEGFHEGVGYRLTGVEYHGGVRKIDEILDHRYGKNEMIEFCRVHTDWYLAAPAGVKRILRRFESNTTTGCGTCEQSYLRGSGA